jgi:hypothetical protein
MQLTPIQRHAAEAEHVAFVVLVAQGSFVAVVSFLCATKQFWPVDDFSHMYAISG